MLGPIMDHARLSVDAVITHYLGRLFVLVPIGIAGGFGVAAGYMILAESLGAIQACAVMAGIFVVIAFIVAMIVLVQERNQRVMLRQAAQQSALVSGLMTAAPVALAGGSSLLRLAGGLKAPLLVGSALVAGLLLTKGASGSTSSDMPT